jgi:hypothetical protein
VISRLPTSLQQDEIPLHVGTPTQQIVVHVSRAATADIDIALRCERRQTRIATILRRAGAQGLLGIGSNDAPRSPVFADPSLDMDAPATNSLGPARLARSRQADRSYFRFCDSQSPCLRYTLLHWPTRPRRKMDTPVGTQFDRLMKIWARSPVNLGVGACVNAVRSSRGATRQLRAQIVSILVPTNTVRAAATGGSPKATRLAAMLAASLLGACASSVKVGPGAVAGLVPDATIEMHQVQVAYLASGGGGNGTLFYRGQAFPFTIGGLGLGGIGASTISASGQVYKLHSLAAFPGTYLQARYGFALGNRSGGDLWLQNNAGVILHLKAEREGLMLSLGGDAIVITMK